ncbi:MAG: cation diffusion facilitator family transporter [Trueperaceae bacterium]|nr:cation diffusion facilitator family transporter [Trueperaceae bacterium]
MRAQGRQRARAARLSLVAALFVLALKGAAWWATGSVSLLSDAAESIVNVVAAATLIAALRWAAQGPDRDHPYGHQKAEYLSSVFEAVLILVAAGAILVSAAQRLAEPQPLERLGLGLAVAVAATAVNGALGAYLLRAGRELRSPALAANGRHVLTDVWTSLGVLVGVALVGATGWSVLDPLLAIVVAANVVREGVRVLTSNVSKLLDERLPEREEQVILDALDAHPLVLGYHRLRTRRSGRARYAEVDVFVDPDLSVRAAHDVVAEVEDAIHGELAELTTTLHVEPFVAGEREGAVRPDQEYPLGRRPRRGQR